MFEKSSFATLSDGTRIPNPEFFREEEKAKALEQRRLSKCLKGIQESAQRMKRAFTKESAPLRGDWLLFNQSHVT
jgi:transposase